MAKEQGVTGPADAKALRGIRQLALTAASGVRIDVHLLAFDLDSFSFADFAASGIACPPSVERSVPKRQAEFYFGRLAARRALDTLGISPGDVGIGAWRQPLWPTGIVGSISHTRSEAAAVVMRQGECHGIGIDLEPIAGLEACAALSGTVIDADELTYLQGVAGSLSIATLLTLAFSAKESLFKAAFNTVGRYFDFSAARIRELDQGRGIITLQLAENLCDTFTYGRACEIGFCFVGPGVVMTYYLW
jgi:4'-phosphopantetheinyl transferase EntD